MRWMAILWILYIQKTKKNRYLHYVIDSYMVDNSRYYVGDRMMYGKFAYLKGK